MKENVKVSKQYKALDLMKIFAAMCVLINHTSPFLPVHPMTNFIFFHIITRVAIPFLFISSGYLFASKVSEKGEKYFKL